VNENQKVMHMWKPRMLDSFHFLSIGFSKKIHFHGFAIVIVIFARWKRDGDSLFKLIEIAIMLVHYVHIVINFNLVYDSSSQGNHASLWACLLFVLKITQYI